jgi:DNA-directed RNA polymerase specialized sigma24 family protein
MVQLWYGKLIAFNFRGCASMPGHFVTMSHRMPGNSSAAGFPTTCWGRILQAGDRAATESRIALEELCRDYWFPLYAFVRRKGNDPETAQDLVQGLFTDLLERGDFSELEPIRGRFRSFLMACCTNYLAKVRSRERAVKRGGGRLCLSLDALSAETRFGGEPAHELTAERLFDQRWALTLLDHIVAGLDAEMAHPEKRPLYDRLRPSLLGQEEVPSYKAIALELGLSEGAVKMSAHRLRARYRERLRDEIARTVADPSEVDDEIRTLLDAVALHSYPGRPRPGPSSLGRLSTGKMTPTSRAFAASRAWPGSPRMSRRRGERSGPMSIPSLIVREGNDRAVSRRALKRDNPADILCDTKFPQRGAAAGTRTDEDARQCRHLA